MPTTFTFATGDGGMGILQITDFTDQPDKGLKLRYKLVQTDATNRQAPGAPGAAAEDAKFENEKNPTAESASKWVLRADAAPILPHDLTFGFAEPESRDGSFHSDQSVAFALSFHSFVPEGVAGRLVPERFDVLLIGQSTWRISLNRELVTITDGSTGGAVADLPWLDDVAQLVKTVTLPVRYGDREHQCPVKLKLRRHDNGKVRGSYWFCAYFAGRLPVGVGGRTFEIVNLDQQMEFRQHDADSHGDAVLGIDINGDGRIDPSADGGERFGLYSPFTIGDRTLRVTEVDPYLPRVVFHELVRGPGDEAAKASEEKNLTAEGADEVQAP